MEDQIKYKNQNSERIVVVQELVDVIDAIREIKYKRAEDMQWAIAAMKAEERNIEKKQYSRQITSLNERLINRAIAAHSSRHSKLLNLTSKEKGLLFLHSGKNKGISTYNCSYN